MDNADSSYTQRSTIGMSECCTFVGNYFNEKPFIEEKNEIEAWMIIGVLYSNTLLGYVFYSAICFCKYG